jgi:4-hydroxy-tetrahydrodipicolinate synthase
MIAPPASVRTDDMIFGCFREVADRPGLAKISALRDAKDIRRVSILVGTGGLFLPEELRRGADGAMTGFAVPEMMAGVVAAHAAEIFDAYLPFARYEQQPGLGLAVRKYIPTKRGAIACAARQERRLRQIG